MNLKQLAKVAARTGGPISGIATLNAQGAGPAFSVNLTDVEVDRETGKVDVLSFTAIQDAGKAIIIAAIVLGALLATVDIPFLTHVFTPH